MKEVIDINNHDGVGTVWENQNSINRMLVSKINQLSNKYQFKKFKTNIKVLTRLQDTSNYIINPITNSSFQFTNELTYYGKLYDVEIYLDPNMTWDNDRIIPMYDESLMRSYKISKIRGKEVKFDMLEELKIENLEI